MNIRFIRRLTMASAVAATALTVSVAPMAHADTHCPATTSSPFPARGVRQRLLRSPGPTSCSTPAHRWSIRRRGRGPTCSSSTSGRRATCTTRATTVASCSISINGGLVDTRSQSRLTIDNRFYNDLITLCNRQIGGNAFVARSLCYSIAATYYAAVRAAGWALFDASPAVPGLQSSGTRPNN